MKRGARALGSAAAGAVLAWWVPLPRDPGAQIAPAGPAAAGRATAERASAPPLDDVPPVEPLDPYAAERDLARIRWGRAPVPPDGARAWTERELTELLQANAGTYTVLRVDCVAHPCIGVLLSPDPMPDWTIRDRLKSSGFPHVQVRASVWSSGDGDVLGSIGRVTVAFLHETPAPETAEAQFVDRLGQAVADRWQTETIEWLAQNAVPGVFP